MAILHLENVPAELYGRIEQLACADRLSPAEEAVRLLHDAVRQKLPGNGGPSPGLSQREIIEDIIRNRFRLQPGTPSVVDMLREDRQR